MGLGWLGALGNVRSSVAFLVVDVVVVLLLGGYVGGLTCWVWLLLMIRPLFASSLKPRVLTLFGARACVVLCARTSLAVRDEVRFALSLLAAQHVFHAASKRALLHVVFVSFCLFLSLNQCSVFFILVLCFESKSWII